MAYVIKHKKNKGYFKLRTEGWTSLEWASTFGTEKLALLQKDKLERSPLYFEKLTVLSEDECPENIRD
jgi:hypothetical protein